MNLTDIVLYLIGGSACLFIGAELLIRGSSSLAVKLGLSPLVIGLTVLAFTTSAPELVVSIKASADGNGGIVIGNIIGSNICNIGLILGVAAIIVPIKAKLQVVKREIPVMIGISLLLSLVLLDGFVSLIEGVVLTAGIVLYVVFGYRTAIKEKNEKLDKVIEKEIPASVKSIPISILLIIAGFLLLVAGAHLFLNGAVETASRLGVSQAVIGLSMVAFGTSLPELLTSIVAAIKKENELAIGNIVGSNVFNILSVLGISSIVNPINASGTNWIDIIVMILFSLILLPFVSSNFVLKRWEGLLLFLGYCSYITYLAVSYL